MFFSDSKVFIWVNIQIISMCGWLWN